MKDGIRIITTGGTFDKFYDEIKGELTFRESNLPRILKQSRCTLPVQLEGPLAIDSLYMNEQQRQEVSQRCLSSYEDRIIVIHGTDTMVETAKVVALNRKKDDSHVIVFTGAMVPYSLENSDSVFNLGCATVAVQLLKSGVYIVMDGKIFDYDKVHKNKAVGLFEGENK